MASQMLAELDMCDCGLHGCVVLSDGTRSEEFSSKEKASFVIAVLEEKGSISLGEAEFLRAWVEQLPKLPHGYLDMRFTQLFTCRGVAEIFVQRKGESPEDFLIRVVEDALDDDASYEGGERKTITIH